MESLREASSSEERGPSDTPTGSHGKLALALGVIAIALSLLLGFVSFRTVRRLEGDVARLKDRIINVPPHQAGGFGLKPR